MSESFAANTSRKLVTTDWVAEHSGDADVRLIESNEDQLLYRSGHIAGAVEVDWVRDLNNQLSRDYLDGEAFSALCSRAGITPETRLVFYGDKSNWWACYALWVFELFGHTNTAIMDGGRLKWEKEGRQLTKEKPSFTPTKYPLCDRDDETNRALRDVVFRQLREHKPLIDVRSPDEFSGKRLHMEDYPNEGALRGGHIPGAKNVPWARAVDSSSGAFLPPSQLKQLYCADLELNADDEVIAYCRIGERSSLTWFVLKYILAFQNVKNYDGSWTEWGNLVGAPIEK